MQIIERDYAKYLGMDLLQNFYLFSLNHVDCKKGQKILSKTSGLAITIKRLKITISSTSKGQILIHFTSVGLLFPLQKENEIWRGNEPEFPQPANGRHVSNPDCLRMSSYLNSYTKLLYTGVFLTKT